MGTSPVLGLLRPSSMDWKSAYQLVLQESDRTLLFKCVEVAEAKLLMHRETLAGCSDCDAERQTIEDALNHLRQVKREKLDFPG
jgi:hypothetical protein